MPYRYCPDCNHWYGTHEYTVDNIGETVCPRDDHYALVGCIHPSRHFETDVRLPYGNREEQQQSLDAAKRQGLVDEFRLLRDAL